MFQVHNVLHWPVKIIRNKGYLLTELFQGVAYDSPGHAGSSSNSFSHFGHLATAFAFALIRLYNSCRWDRSAENNPSMILGLICATDPSLVTTRASRIMMRYAWFACTLGSLIGRISSAAVASRITPSRCRFPSVS